MADLVGAPVAVAIEAFLAHPDLMRSEPRALRALGVQEVAVCTPNFQRQVYERYARPAGC